MQVRIVDDEHEPDLFWALRGGGGNFGVAASLEFETHPLDTVLGGLLAHPLAAAGDVIDRFRQFTKDLPDEATVFCGLVHAPDGSGAKLCALPLCHAGELDQAEAELGRCGEFGPPVIDLVQPMPYPVGQHACSTTRSPGRAELLAVGVLHRAQRRRRADDGRGVRGGPVADDGHGPRELPRRRCRVAPTATAFPLREPGVQPRARPASGDPADTAANMHGCATPSPRSRRIRRHART